MIVRFLSWLLKAEHKKRYVKEEIFINTGKSKISLLTSVFQNFGIFVLLVMQFGVPGELALFLGIAGGVMYLALSRVLGWLWFRMGFAAEQQSYSNNFNPELQRIMEDVRK